MLTPHLSNLIAGGLSLMVPAIVYFFSLARTPYRAGYFFWCVLAGVTQVFAALDLTGCTLFGRYMACLGIGVGFMLIPTLVVEIVAADTPESPIAQWRRRHPLHEPKVPEPTRQTLAWEVNVRPERTHLKVPTDLVVVEVRRGDDYRVVGTADPVGDYEKYAALKVRAEDFATTYNNEKIW